MKKKFLISSDLSVVQKVSAQALAFLKPLALSDVCRFDLRLCLEEALINAIKHGNKQKKAAKVHLTVESDKKKVFFVVEDEGCGFDPVKLPDCTQKSNLWKCRGRGIYLIHQLMDKVDYNSKGNCVRMVKFLKKEDGSRPKRRIYGS